MATASMKRRVTATTTDEDTVCRAAAKAGVNTLLKNLDLDDETTRCTDVVD